MASEVTICNQALGWLGQSPITSLDDPSTVAQLCKANYDELRQSVLEEGNWSFASARFMLTEVIAPTDDNWGNYHWFTIPPGQLLIRGVYKNQQEHRQIEDWRVEGDYILAEATTIYIRTISDYESPNGMTASFRNALSARIAWELCIPITQSAKLEAKLEHNYEEKIGKALLADGTQGARENVIADRLVRVRGG